MSTNTTCGQEYLTIPLPNHPPQHPLGWSPDDPSPLTDLPYYHGDPLHAVLSATDDPNVFNLGDFDVNELFDGSREIEVSMGSNMIPSAFVDMNQYSAFTNNFFYDLDAQSQFTQPDPSTFASTSSGTSEQPSGLTTPFDPVQRTPIAGAIDRLGPYTFDSVLDERRRVSFEETDFGSVAPHDTQAQRTPTPTPQDAAPGGAYMPPAGASNSSTRRVAADWRHIRLTPEPEPTREVWNGQGR
jgi:hypothetical protein